MKNNRTRKNIRLKDYDYSSNGGYFITICTKDRECFFGEINNGKMELNNIGEMAQNFWKKIPEYFNFVELNEFIIMPNHIHGIICIQNDLKKSIDQSLNTDAINRHPYKIESKIVGSSIYGDLKKKFNNKSGLINKDVINRIPTGGTTERNNPMGTKSLGEIIRWFKGRTTFEIHKQCEYFFWQSRFHDRIIRNEKEHQSISEYISYNPENWQEDELYKKV